MDFKEYYSKHYNPKYFTLSNYELTIDPTETMDEVNSYDMDRQKKEIVKCVNSFEYFCHKYIKILHPVKGLIPFVPFNYQRKVISEYEKNRFNIISKFRQGGLTTVTLLWGLWRCMFKLDQQIMLISKTDREATDTGAIIDRAVEHLPSWLIPKKDKKWNDHLKEFSDTGGALKFYSPEASRGKSVTFLIIDEAAFIPDMDKHWKAMWPVLSTGGSCVLISTVNGMGNWYEQTYNDAREKRNMFNVIDLDYWEHPEYNNEKWIDEQKRQLGEKGFLQEVLREFLGSGETYIPSNIIRELTEYTGKMPPIKKLFPKWTNKNGRAAQLETDDSNKGALWVWKEPNESKEYIIGVDCADGMGEDADNSCFQVLDMETLEQVAEFYSNLIPPHIFAQIIKEVGVYYNTALVVVENMAAGGAVLSSLQNTLFYENIFYETKKSGSQTIGFKVNRINRPMLLEAMQSRILSKSIRINSARLTSELQTFEFNPVTKRAEAQKRKHDDAISALCLCLYIRNQIAQDLPVGASAPQDMTSLVDDVCKEIKRELFDSRYEDFIEEEISTSSSINEDEQETLLNLYRKNNKILKEFGW
jgi:hypothetical protein